MYLCIYLCFVCVLTQSIRGHSRGEAFRDVHYPKEYSSQTGGGDAETGNLNKTLVVELMESAEFAA